MLKRSSIITFFWFVQSLGQSLSGFENAPRNLTQRIDYFSEYFIGSPYAQNPLGEAHKDMVDQDPLIRFDKFDCLTYIETVLALSFAKNDDEVLNSMVQLRYENGQIGFEFRHHFVEHGWLPSARKLNYLKDVTAELFPKEVKFKSEPIDIKSWFLKLNVPSLGTSSHSLMDRKDKIAQIAQSQEVVESEITFLPKENVIKNPSLLARIPQSAVEFFVVDSGEKYLRSIGTRLMVVHGGIINIKNGKVYVRHASSRPKQKKVVEENLLVFFQSQIRFPNLLGIHIEVPTVN